jgi:peptidoglycan/LPS O-acetylase OafA/YrhL
LHTPTPPHTHGFTTVTDVIVYFGFLQIYFHHYVLGGISAAWTLCVEMSFYLFLPLYAAVLATSRRRPLRAQVVGLGTLFAISLVWKFAVYAHPTTQQTGAATWLPAQLDLFVLGMALAVAKVWWTQHGTEPAWLSHRWMPAVAWGAALASFVVVCSIGLPLVPLYNATLGQALARQWLYGAFGFLLVLPAVFGPQDRGAVRGVLRSRPFVAIGMVSYGIYLWHEPWIYQLLKWSHRPLFTQSFWWMSGWVAVLAVACATASFWLIEQPFQRLGQKSRGGASRQDATQRAEPVIVDGSGPQDAMATANPGGESAYR